MPDRQRSVTWVASKHGLFQHAVRGEYRYQPGQWVRTECGSEVRPHHWEMAPPEEVCAGCTQAVQARQRGRARA